MKDTSITLLGKTNKFFIAVPSIF